MKIEEEPLFHMDEINPTLYEVVSELKEVKVYLVFSKQTNKQTNQPKNKQINIYNSFFFLPSKVLIPVCPRKNLGC